VDFASPSRQLSLAQSYRSLNMSRPFSFALGQPLPWRLRLKTLLAMTARADEHTR
jgi:hypothetical protein